MIIPDVKGFGGQIFARRAERSIYQSRCGERRIDVGDKPAAGLAAAIDDANRVHRCRRLQLWEIIVRLRQDLAGKSRSFPPCQGRHEGVNCHPGRLMNLRRNIANAMSLMPARFKTG